MSQRTISLVVAVQREQALDSGAWVWTALPQGYPGSAGGRTIAELHEEVEALKHFITGTDQPTEIAVDYVYEVPGLSSEVLVDYRHGRSRRDEAAAELAAPMTTLARRHGARRRRCVPPGCLFATAQRS